MAPATVSSPTGGPERAMVAGLLPSEHVALEMAQGEGFVLQAFYAVIDTLDHKPSVDILKRAVKQEERHVEFGEQQTAKAIEGKPWLRRRRGSFAPRRAPAARLL